MIRSASLVMLAAALAAADAPRDPMVLDEQLQQALAEPRPVAPTAPQTEPSPLQPAVATPPLPADHPIICLTLLYPNAADIGNAIRNLYGGRVALSISDADSAVVNDLKRRFERFDIVDGRTQGIGLETNNSESGTTNQNTPTTNQSDAGFTTTPQMAIGPDTILVTVFRRQNRIILRTGDTAALARIRDLVRRLDVPTPQVLLEVRMIAVELGDGFESFFDYQGSKGKTSGAFASGTITQPTPPSLMPGGTGLRTGDLVFQFVNDHFAARMQLLESKKRLSLVASPLLLTSNNEVSRLFIGREVPLNRTFNLSQNTNTNTGTQQANSGTQIEFRPVGTTLLITPNINADRSVTLRIVQERSDADSTATLLVPDTTGFKPQTINIVSSQTVSGTIVARSGLAVAFGGMVEQRRSTNQEQIPGLGSIPVLGFFFRRDERSDTRREIVVMVRPHVLSTPAESEAISRRVLGRLGADPIGTDMSTMPAKTSIRPFPSFLIDSVQP